MAKRNNKSIKFFVTQCCVWVFLYYFRCAHYLMFLIGLKLFTIPFIFINTIHRFKGLLICS
jgi:hypothetical protein